MEKTKLVEMRKLKRITQGQIADYLNMSITCYHRREKGQVYIKEEEWDKIAKFLNVPVDEIYEPDEPQSFTCKDNAFSNHLGTNNGTNYFYTVHKELLETQQKYIVILEKRIKELEQLLAKK